MPEREKAVFPRAVGRSSGGLELRCVIFARRRDAVVLIRHRRHPTAGEAWTLPGGTLDYGMTPRESAARMLIDQAGVSADSMRLLGVESSAHANWTLLFQFDARITAEPVAGAGIAEVRLESIERSLAGELDFLARQQLEKYRIHELSTTA